MISVSLRELSIETAHSEVRVADNDMKVFIAIDFHRTQVNSCMVKFWDDNWKIHYGLPLSDWLT